MRRPGVRGRQRRRERSDVAPDMAVAPWLAMTVPADPVGPTARFRPAGFAPFAISLLLPNRPLPRAAVELARVIREGLGRR